MGKKYSVVYWKSSSDDHKFHQYIRVNKDKVDNKKIWPGFPSGGKPLGRVFWEARPAWGFPGRDTWPGKPLGAGRRGKEVGLWGAVLPPPSNNAGASHQLRSTPRHYRKQNSFCGINCFCTSSHFASSLLQALSSGAGPHAEEAPATPTSGWEEQAQCCVAFFRVLGTLFSTWWLNFPWVRTWLFLWKKYQGQPLK